MHNNQLWHIAHNFQIPAEIIDISAFGSGKINDTFIITTSDPTQCFILQAINQAVFANPQLVMQNMNIVTEHVRQKLIHTDDYSTWQIFSVIHTQQHMPYCIDNDNNYWRVISCIDNAQSFDTINDQTMAQQVGKALGIFHNLISDIDTDILTDTLEGFHITPRYLADYDIVLDSRKETDILCDNARYCQQFITDRRDFASVLENAKHDGTLALRVMHGDPKVNNIMFDNDTGQAVSMIDLDTVTMGLIHYDIGDCLRSGCNTLAEEASPSQWDNVRFDLDTCRSILTGYLSQANQFLTEHDYHYLYDCIRLIPFELGLRFFSDYLQGNVYFKVDDNKPQQNLYQAIVQFKLTESIEQQKEAIEHIIKDCQQAFV